MYKTRDREEAQLLQENDVEILAISNVIGANGRPLFNSKAKVGERKVKEYTFSCEESEVKDILKGKIEVNEKDAEIERLIKVIDEMKSAKKPGRPKKEEK
jgi:hypothetical protein